ncbi:MAG: site-specific integrase [bacterium]
MGIYKKANSNNFMMSKTVNGLTYFKSSGTNLKMEARATFDRWVIELKEQILTGKPVRQERETINNYTFSELADKYLEFIDGRLKSFYDTSLFVKTLLKRFKDTRLADFSMQDLELLQSDWINQNFSIAYANRLTAILKRMFTKAYDWEMIDEDILKRVRKAKQLKGENKRLRYLSEEEAERLISNCEPYLRPIVITALMTGMRKSEILHLTWDRVDLKNKVILLDKTKNGERREIPINNILYNVLSGIVRNLKTDYVFYNPETLKPYYDVKKSFTAALRKSHILDFRFHDLRHTFASWLIMGGIDLTTVKELLGHKDIKMTLRYSHLAASHISNAVKILEKNFTDSLPQEQKQKNEFLESV